MKNVLLVPTDFSEVCFSAIEHAVGLAKKIKYKVYIMHVINNVTEAYLKKNNLPESHIDDKLKEIVFEIKRKYNFDIDYLIKRGSIFTEINEGARDVEAEFVILGAQEKSGVQYFVGSYLLKVVESLEVPSIVVKNTPFNGYRNMVFPMGVDAEPRQKVKWVVQLAKQFNSTVYIVPKYEFDELLDKKLNIWIDQITRNFEKYKINYVLKKTDKEFCEKYGENLLSYSHDIQADLMVITIMTKTTQLLKNLLGSWEEKMLYNPYHIPMLCINPQIYGLKKLSSIVIGA